MTAAGALTPLLSEAATALLFRASRGVPRVAAHLLRSALFLADECGQNDLDENILLAAIDALRITPGSNNPAVPSDPNASVPGPAEVRRRAFAGLKQLLFRIAEQRPLIVFLDNLQWGDLDSARLLDDLMAPPAGIPALVRCYGPV